MCGVFQRTKNHKNKRLEDLRYQNEFIDLFLIHMMLMMMMISFTEEKEMKKKNKTKTAPLM